MCMQVALPSLHSSLSFPTFHRKRVLNTYRLCTGEMYLFVRGPRFRQMQVDTVFSLIYLQFVSVCEAHRFFIFWGADIRECVFMLFLNCRLCEKHRRAPGRLVSICFA